MGKIFQAETWPLERAQRGSMRGFGFPTRPLLDSLRLSSRPVFIFGIVKT